MPRSNARRKRFRGPTIALLALVVLFCGLLARSAVPAAKEPLVKASSVPAQAPPTLPPQPTPTDTPAPTPVAQMAALATPVTLGEDGSGILLRSAAPAATNAPQATAQATQAATIAPSPSPSPEPTPSPVPTPASTPLSFGELTKDLVPNAGPTPTYTYSNDNVQVDVYKHEIKNVVYFATEIRLSDITYLRSAFSRDQFNSTAEPPKDIAIRNDAIWAINSDFVTFNNGGIVIRNGDLYRDNKSTRHMLVIDKNGDFTVYRDAIDNPEAFAADLHAAGVWQTLVFGPSLVENGVAVELPNKYFISTGKALEPRTAIAQLGPLHYLILTVDGRQDGYSQGVSLGRLQELMVQHGAITAFNLDGGGSTSLFFDGEIINKPAGGGQRHVPDILYIGR